MENILGPHQFARNQRWVLTGDSDWCGWCSTRVLAQPCVRRNKGSHTEKKAPMEVRKFYLNYGVQGELEPRLNPLPSTLPLN